MAIYGYEAVDKAGKEVKGSIEADSMEKARYDLKMQGITILSLTEQSVLTRDINIEIGGKPTPRDLSIFCRQFVSMVRAGVTIRDALKMLADATENEKLKQAIWAVRVSTEKGETLADALAEHPKIFPSLMINIVTAGEASGSLDISMERAAIQFERSYKTKALIKKTMTYPIVVCLVAIAVVIVMLVAVIPSYANMFANLGTDMPGITLIVMKASNFLVKHWFFLTILAVTFAFGLMWFKNTDAGRHVTGKIALKIPVIANLVTKNASAQMARTLSTLLGAGVPLVEAVGIVAGTMENVWFREALEKATEEITIGRSLSEALQECGLFPPMVYHMTGIGEESGNTEEMLDKLAAYYEEEVEMAVQTLMAALEPMIIIVLAVIVGFLIAACMAPMLSMYDALNNL